MKIASILKKVVMSVTGLLLVGFLVTHLAGNQFIYFGDKSFNAYAEFLESKPAVVYTAEIALLLIFLIHIYYALRLTLENKAARPTANAERKTAGESTFSSRNMLITGVIIFGFLILHIWQFKFGNKVGSRPEQNGLWWLVVVKTFQDPMYFAIYAVSMIALGLHISHGIGSAFQSLGLFSRHRHTVQRIGYVIGWVLALGFLALPIYAIVVKPAGSMTVLTEVKADRLEHK